MRRRAERPGCAERTRCAERRVRRAAERPVEAGSGLAERVRVRAEGGAGEGGRVRGEGRVRAAGDLRRARSVGRLRALLLRDGCGGLGRRGGGRLGGRGGGGGGGGRTRGGSGGLRERVSSERLFGRKSSKEEGRTPTMAGSLGAASGAGPSICRSLTSEARKTMKLRATRTGLASVRRRKEGGELWTHS